MVFCRDCFKDYEIRSVIELCNHKGSCPVCGSRDTWIYDSDIDGEIVNVDEMLESIIEIYTPESDLPALFPEKEKDWLKHIILRDWDVFPQSADYIGTLLNDFVDCSLNLDKRILSEKVGIPELFDDRFLSERSILGRNNWGDFKESLRHNNRFHTDIVNLDYLAEILKETETNVHKGSKLYRARVTDKKGFHSSEMGAPPDDAASPGRVNSKGQSCLYLCSKRETTVKEIRARAFDYVTIATFRLERDIKVLDLSTISHNSPFYTESNKIEYLINEKTLKQIREDLAKPMSRLDSDLDYLPTQYISDFAKYLGYDGVKYYSTFDPKAYNIAVFDTTSCSPIYTRTYRIGNLEYILNTI